MGNKSDPSPPVLWKAVLRESMEERTDTFWPEVALHLQ